MKFFIYISLLFIALSKINVVEYGKEIPFDMNNKELELTFNEEGALLISITFDTPDILNLTMDFKGSSYNDLLNPPGIATIMNFGPNYINRIILDYLSPSNAKGTIWLQPLNEELPIKLNQNYEWKYNLKKTLFNTANYQLVYIINKSEKDAIMNFKYDNNFKVEENVIAQNPSKICHGNICINGITTYNIKKGESYKIYIKINFIEKSMGIGPAKITYYLPSFSFHFNYEEEKKPEEKSTLITMLIISNILLLMVIIITCILLIRRRGIFSNEIKKFELKETDIIL